MNNNSKKETAKKVVLSIALLNVLAASNVALAASDSTVQPKKQQLASYEVTSLATESGTDLFDNDGCSYNNGCKV